MASGSSQALGHPLSWGCCAPALSWGEDTPEHPQLSTGMKTECSQHSKGRFPWENPPKGSCQSCQRLRGEEMPQPSSQGSSNSGRGDGACNSIPG